MNPHLLICSLTRRALSKEILLVIFIIGMAFSVRTWDIGWNGFNGDESIYSGQAASILGDEDFLRNFAVFRGHPLLLQSMVSISFALFGIQDVTARIVPAIFGTLTVFMTYLTAKELFDKKIGLICCLVLALLPFHIVFSRQVLVDVPLSFFVVLFLFFTFRSTKTENNLYFYLTGVSCGLCFISKEVGLITIPIFLLYTLLVSSLKLDKILIYFSGFVSAASPYIFLILTRPDATDAFYQYTIFQLTREGHMFLSQYLSILINEALGYVLSILILVSVILILMDFRKLKNTTYRDQILLLILTLGSFFLFYQLLPASGDRFMISLVPIGVVLGCSFLVSNTIRRIKAQRFLYIIIVPLILLSTNTFLSKVFPIEDLRISDTLGTTWKRDAAFWIKHNTSTETGILTDNTPFANIIKFYSSHNVYAISSNPNPSYSQIANPALLFLNKNISIIVQDLDPQYQSKASDELTSFLQLFDPELVYTAYKYTMKDNKEIAVPMVKIYELK